MLNLILVAGLYLTPPFAVQDRPVDTSAFYEWWYEATGMYEVYDKPPPGISRTQLIYDSLNNSAFLARWPEVNWIKIDLNLNCGEAAYGTDEVHFSLYWLKGEKYPFLEMITNGPARGP